MNKKLKPIPAGNKGLPNLPKPVRNKMGFLKEGGMADKRSPFMGGGIAYAGGGRAMKRKMYSEGTPAIKKPKNPIRKEPLKVKDPRREMMKLSPELKKILKKRFEGVQRKK